MKERAFQSAVRLLTKDEKKNGLGLVAMLVVLSILDFVSIAAFLPLIVMVADPTGITNKLNELNLAGILSNDNGLTIAICLTIFAGIFFLLKTVANLFINSRKAAYAYSVAERLAGEAYHGFIHGPFTSFTSADYSKRLNEVANLPLMFANNILIPAGTILSESVLAILFLLCIAIIDLRLFLFLCLLSLPACAVYQLQKRVLRRSSEAVKRYYPALIKRAQEGIESYAEIRSFQKERTFAAAISQAFRNLGGVFAKDHIRNSSVSRITEGVAALYLCTILLYFLIARPNDSNALVVLSVYAGISFRTIPSVNRILAALVQIRGNQYVMDGLTSHQEQSPPQNAYSTHQKDVSIKKGIELRNASFYYHHTKLILDQINITIHKGSRVMIYGKSGSGKTTLLHLLMGFLHLDKGEILIDDEKKGEIFEFRKLIGFVPQNPLMLDATIAENIAFGENPEVNYTLIQKIITDLHLDSWIKTLPEGLHTTIGERGNKISGGQRQRIALGRALYHGKEVLLLDEVTNQLDAESEGEIMQTLIRLSCENKTIVMITHKQELIPYFDMVYLLDNGKLAIHSKALKPVS